MAATPEKLSAPPRTQQAGKLLEATEEVKVLPPHIEALPKSQQEVVAKMVTLDLEYFKLEKAFDTELSALMAKYEKKYAPVLEQRAVEIKAIPGFWKSVLQRSEEFGEMIEEHDEPVLDSLLDIKAEYFEDRDAGWKLSFHFAENDYFTNTVLTKTYYTEAANDWDTSVETNKIESDKIEWKPSKDVTVELVSKKVKGGGKKKAKQKAAKEMPRASFFRFFRNLGPMFDIPTDVEDEDEDDDDEEEVEDKLERLMDEDGDAAEGLRDTVIPHAVRYFTHEAGQDDESDDDEDADGEEDEDEDDKDDLSDTPP